MVILIDKYLNILFQVCLVTKKIIKHVLAYIMIFISALLFFSTLGYYIFIFDWHMEKKEIAINTVILTLLSVVSIAIYYFAEKLKN